MVEIVDEAEELRRFLKRVNLATSHYEVLGISRNGLPDDLKAIYRTSWEIPMRSLIDMAADRGAFIDQSQSLNLFMESPSIGKLSSMYMYAWQKGLKTTYYLRSRPATKIAQVTAAETATAEVQAYSDTEAVVCSLENPDACEACQ